MANGKNPYLRYRIIHTCFTSKHKPYWTIDEFIEKLAEHDFIVARRTIEDDFAMMRSDERLNYKAPIAYSRQHKAFYYTDRDHSIDNVPLTAGDLDVLTAATSIIEQYRGVKLVEQFEGVVDKLSKVVKQLKNTEKQKILAFEESPYYKGHDHFDAVYGAIANRQSLQITYRKFASEQCASSLLYERIPRPLVCAGP